MGLKAPHKDIYDPPSNNDKLPQLPCQMASYSRNPSAPSNSAAGFASSLSSSAIPCGHIITVNALLPLPDKASEIAKQIAKFPKLRNISLYKDKTYKFYDSAGRLIYANYESALVYKYRAIAGRSCGKYRKADYPGGLYIRYIILAGFFNNTYTNYKNNTEASYYLIFSKLFYISY
jgi:hypothetical protein